MKQRMFLILIGIMLIVPTLIFAHLSSQQSSFEIRSQTSSSLDLRFNLPAWNLEASDAKNPDVKSIKAEDNPKLFIDEEETLPIFTTNIAIPYSGGVTLTVVNRSQATERSIELDCKGTLLKEKQEGRLSSDFYPENYIQISEPVVIRDMRIVSINVYPFQYNPEASLLSINQTIDFRLTYDSLPSQNEIQPPTSISRSFERIYRDLILNYDTFVGRNVVYQAPVMLVIYGNYTNASYTAKVNEYIAWKKQKGYKVFSASTSVTGTSNTAIKNYIQNAYNTWVDRPEHIVLIGDVGGTIAVPTFTYNGSEGDYQYTWLAGGDILGDAFVGRISIASSGDMEIQMAKIIKMDRDIDLGVAAYMNNMLLVGDPSASGISTIYANKYIKELSHQIYPSYNYTEVYSGSFASQINNAITAGVSFFHYRGYIGVSSWSPPTSPLNGQKLYHSVIITCNTGSFAGTSLTENVIRTGTAAGLGGGITSIGMATSSTHTPMNNFLSQGIFYGIYALGMRTMGEPLLYTKLYLHSVYGISNASQCQFFSQMCNLMGDPTSTVYVGQPSSFNVVAPSTIPSGTTNYEVTVRNAANVLMPNAVVTLTNSSTLHEIATTDETGRAMFDLPAGLSGTMTLTVNMNEHKPTVSTITINAAGGLVFENLMVDDDATAPSNGNNDDIVNSGETIELWPSFRNTSSTPITVNGIASVNDAYVSMTGSTVQTGTIASGSTAQSTVPLVFTVSSDCPDFHRISITVAENSPTPSWSFVIPVDVASGRFQIQGYTAVGAVGNIIHAGDLLPLKINIRNIGSANLANIYGILRSSDSFFTIQDSVGYFGTVNVDSNVENDADTFSFQVAGQAINGMVIPLELVLYNAAGFSEILPFTLTIGQSNQNDPLGQDAYGYYIFDWGDTTYPQCPNYSWIGIAPAEGGNGTALTLSDPGSSSDEGDQNSSSSITTVNLPFAFKFYGTQYSQISVSSNGFIAFGASTNSDWRNGRLPGPVGPNPMLAVFWDDLQLNNGSYVYTWHNSAQHYYVVEWYNVINGYDRVTPETFQAILYDPVYYPTATGDGQIKLQYKLFSNIDLGSGDSHPHGNYATIGIKNQYGTVGLEYTFNNTYPTAARPLSNEKAIFITTSPVPMDGPYLMIENVTVFDTNLNGMLEPAENAEIGIRLGNIGTVNATNVSAILTSSDTNITIVNNSSNYGTITELNNAMPQNNMEVTISNNCSNGYQIPCNLAITSNQGAWSYDFTLTVHAPDFTFGYYVAQDSGGNNNGVFDPGETVNISIPMTNNGGLASLPGTAVLSTSTPGVIVNNNTVNFNSLGVGDTSNLVFNVTALESVAMGTLAAFNLAIQAGEFVQNSQYPIEVGAPIEIIIGTGTTNQSYPIDRYYNYSTHEAIYLASEVQMAGSIKSLAYHKDSGGDTSPIESVNIYLKHTNQTSLSSGNYNLNGYTLVYSGSFPNISTSGWMEVNLSPMFSYDGESNLGILVIKGMQQWITDYPHWGCSHSTAPRARQSRSDSSQPTNLQSTSSLPNILLRLYSTGAAYLAPENFTALPSHQSVLLSWDAPSSGVPTGYKIFKNNDLITTVTSLTYTDLAVTNYQQYSYYLKAVYEDGESEPTETIIVTPQPQVPQNLVGIGANTMAMLTWNAVAAVRELRNSSENDRLVTGYRIYRDDVPIAVATTNSYTDSGLVNDTGYTYYVTTVYTNPDGESGPSNSVTVIPQENAYAILGTDNNVTALNYISPINTSYRSIHGQSVYTAGELNAAGVIGPVFITQLGFNVASTPNLPLANFLVRMKHTIEEHVQEWQSQDGMQTVYTNAAYQPVAGGWDMLVLNSPFLWNGTDNLVIDTAFGMVDEWSHTGTLEFSTVNAGYRYAVSDDENQTNVFTGGGMNNRRPNVRIAIQSTIPGPEIDADPQSISYGQVLINTPAIRTFSVENTGGQTLTGTIHAPNRFTISAMGEQSRDPGSGVLQLNRNILPFSINPGQSQNFTLKFLPTQAQSYDATLLIISNAENIATLNIPIEAEAYIPPINLTMIRGEGSPRFQLSWQPRSGARAYEVYRSSRPDGGFELIGTTTDTFFTDQDIHDRVFYYVKPISQ